MKATMPAYLLKTEDENTLLGEISNEWQGGLPFTLLYSADGKIFHALNGKMRYQRMKDQIEKSLLIK
jgi:hypothetical protein